MTVYFTDTFTGTNGAAWSANWTNAVSGTGASATIQSNKGRQNAGTNSSGTRVQRYSGSNITNTQISGKVIFNSSSTAGFLELWIRADDATNLGNGYFLAMQVGSKPVLRKGASFTYPSIATLSSAPTIAQSTEYGFKLYAVGSTVKAKFWATSGGEPSSFDFSGTDTTHSGAGQVVFNLSNGSGTTGYNIDLDDVQLDDGSGATITLTGSCTASGVLTKNVTKNPFTGSITASGVLVKIKVVTKVFTGSITATGALTKSALKTLTGSITSAGVLTKQARKTFTGSVTATGFFRKSFVRVFSGSITAHGSVVVTNIGRVFGRPGRAVMRVMKAAEAFVRLRRN